MATKGQRVGIWIIAGTMMIGTIGGFVAMMIEPSNASRDEAALEAANAEWEAAQAEVDKLLEAQAVELSAQYFDTFSPFAKRVGTFDAGTVSELGIEDIVVGDGEEVVADTKLAVYYIGWTPDGNIFDQSIDGGALISPFAIDGPATASVIEGWQQGLIGMRIGGVRELTIPSDLGYGEAGSGDNIPANTPLKFVVMAITAPEEIPDAEIPQLIKDHYRRTYGVEL